MLGDGEQKRLGPFCSEEAAARAYDAEMRLHKRRVVNFPTLPGEVQAVYGEQECVTLREHERNPNRVVEPVRRTWTRKPKAETPPPPPPPAPAPPPPPPPSPPVKKEERLYKGVAQSSTHRFSATITAYNKKTPLGTFASAKEAADAYDARVRQMGGRVVNTPLLPGELQAVHGELDSVTNHRANGEAARAGTLPPRTSPRVAGLPPPQPRELPAAKRKAAKSPTARDSDDEDDEDARAEKPEPKRPRSLAIVLVPPQPPAAQLQPALAPAAPPAQAAPVAIAEPPAINANVVAVPPPSAADGDLVAFLRGITPPLSDVERVAAAAAASGLQLREVRDAVVAAPAVAHAHANQTANLHLVADILGIHRGMDKLALLSALQRAR